jgi:hypothetical protein
MNERMMGVEQNIQKEFASIQEPIDVQEKIADVKRKIIIETDDAKREVLHTQYAALLQYQKALSLPERPGAATDSSDGLHRLAEPWREKMYPGILAADAMKVRPYDAPEETPSPKIANNVVPIRNTDATPVMARKPRQSSNDQEQAAK